jgi:hypothetical protein
MWLESDAAREHASVKMIQGAAVQSDKTIQVA